ncbi:MAG TPA: CGNR zinc finger domain-containing protein [Gemmatimonadaceae bacterium]
MTIPHPLPAGAAEPLPFKFVGGALPLDFVNTVDWLEPVSDVPPSPAALWRDRLGDYDALLAWAAEAGVLSDAERGALADRARREPYAAREAHARAIALRAAVRAAVTAAAAGEPPAPWSAATLDAAITHALHHRRLDLSTGTPHWRWVDDGEPLDRVRWAVALGAAELLAGPELGAVRTCLGEDCGWMYVDRSRNHQRRWCEMAICGNRAKARRHYARRKESRGR